MVSEFLWVGRVSRWLVKITQFFLEMAAKPERMVSCSVFASAILCKLFYCKCDELAWSPTTSSHSMGVLLTLQLWVKLLRNQGKRYARSPFKRFPLQNNDFLQQAWKKKKLFIHFSELNWIFRICSRLFPIGFNLKLDRHTTKIPTINLALQCEKEVLT